MSEESTTPDLVELTRRQFEAVNGRDMDALIDRCTPDAVYDTSPDGMGSYKGPAAIRAFAEGWWGAFEELALEPEDVVDLGHGLVLAVVLQRGRPATSTGRVQRREAYVLEWVGDMIRRVTVYSDADEGRSAAERLAQERGQAMSQENVETVRRLLDACNRRDWDAMLLTGDPEIEIVTLMSGTHRGHAAWRRVVEHMAEEVSGFQFVPEDLIDVGQARVVAVTRWAGTGRTSGIAVPDTTIGFLYTLRDGLVVCQESFRSKDDALKAVGLEE